jgi:hypothetical protein
MDAHDSLDPKLERDEHTLPFTDLVWAKNKLEEAEAHAIAIETIAYHVAALIRGRISSRK